MPLKRLHFNMRPYTKADLTLLDQKLLGLSIIDAAADKPPKTFLSLPGEIRNKVYELVSSSCSVETINWTTPLTLPARLAQVSRQVRQEYLPIYHRHRKIHLTLPRGARRVSSETRNWLAVFGASRLPMAEMISIYSNRASCVLHFRDGGYKVETLLFRRGTMSIYGFATGGFVPGTMLKKAMGEVIELEGEARENGSPYMTVKLLGLLVEVVARSGGKQDSLG